MRDGNSGGATIQSRIVRYDDLAPCYNAFIDSRTPGSDAKENFTIIGPGVSENPDQHVHIAEPHGFNIGGARQPPNCVNSQHSHDTAEVFVVHTGRWRFDFGEHGTDASVEAAAGDIVSFPTNVFRGFTNIGDDVGFLFAVLGGDDPGKVTWAPRVFEMAREYGLALLENGALIDVAAGQTPPPGVGLMKPTDRETVARLRRLTDDDAAGVIVRAGEQSIADGAVVETPLIGAACPDEGLAAGPLGQDHGFAVRRLTLGAGASLEDYRRDIAEVIFMHRGSATVRIDQEETTLHAGDTVTFPVGSRRSLASAEGATMFRVVGEPDGA